MQLILALALVQLGAAPAAATKPAARDAGTAPGEPERLPTDLSPLIEVLSTSDGGFPFAKYRWQVPDLHSWVEVPTVQVVNGLPVRFSAAMSRHDIPYLMDFYAKEFMRAGLYIPPPEDAKALNLGDRFFQLTGLDTDNLISYTVMFQQVDRNMTTVIMSQGYLQEWLKKKRDASPGDFAPLAPAATLVVRSHAEDVDIITYSTQITPADVMAFYRDTLGKAGFLQGSEPGIFERAGEQIKVRARKDERPRVAGSQTAVMLERRQRGR